jgi:hypothetical protein
MLVTFDFLEKWNFSIELPGEVRTKETIEKYNKFKEKIKSENISIGEFIKNKYLTDKLYSFNLNTYPYNIENNMQHYVLWISPLFKKKINDKMICKLITDKMEELGYNEYFCFENHIKAKSILEILHYQVFFRKC